LKVFSGFTQLSQNIRATCALQRIFRAAPLGRVVEDLSAANAVQCSDCFRRSVVIIFSTKRLREKLIHA
jgi:hypothetical protein